MMDAILSSFFGNQHFFLAVEIIPVAPRNRFVVAIRVYCDDNVSETELCKHVIVLLTFFAYFDHF